MFGLVRCKNTFPPGFCVAQIQLRLLTSFVPWPRVWTAAGGYGALPAPATPMAASPVNRSGPHVYSGYKVSLHYLLNRIMEQDFTPGRNLGGLLEKGGKS